MNLKHTFRTRQFTRLDFRVTSLAKRDQVRQVVSGKVIAIKTTVRRDVMDIHNLALARLLTLAAWTRHGMPAIGKVAIQIAENLVRMVGVVYRLPTMQTVVHSVSLSLYPVMLVSSGGISRCFGLQTLDTNTDYTVHGALLQ
jgi:hypothetical protein